jgi:hypothetical protein
VEVRISTGSWLLGGAILSGALLLTGCAGSGSAGGGGASASPKPLTAAQACGERPSASGDIYVWTTTPGVLPQVQVLNGKWGWDSTTSKCVTSVQFVMAHAPKAAGNCTQVGYVADNPGYHMHGASAPKLKHVVAETGPAC